MMLDVFFYLIRTSIGTQEPCDGKLNGFSSEQWQSLFEISKRQALLGVVWGGIEKLPKSQCPPKNILIKWFSYAEQIRKQNQFMNKRTVEVSNLFKKYGWKHCILKGQSVAALYPDPLLRQPGDIDVWFDGKRKDIISYVEHTGEKTHLCYLHCDVPFISDVPVEVHFMPSFMTSPIKNYKLQKWFKREKESQMNNFISISENKVLIPTPTKAFNEVFMLHHIYRHLFSEGIGLRQICDYAVLMKDSSYNKGVRDMICELGLERFAKGLIWILVTYFNINENNLFFEPDEKEGRFLFEEILQSGNFGRYDVRYSAKSKTRFDRISKKIHRNFTFLSKYPSEVLWYVPFVSWETLRYKLLHC